MCITMSPVSVIPTLGLEKEKGSFFLPIHGTIHWQLAAFVSMVNTAITVRHFHSTQTSLTNAKQMMAL